MNYLIEINAFYRWKMQKQAPPSVQALWYHLMGKCNEFGWAKTFTQTNTQICAETGLIERTLHNARNFLIENNRITYKKGTTNQCGTYSLIPFAANVSTSNSTDVSTMNSIDVSTGVSTLNKQNYIYKENKNKNYFNPNVIPKRKKESWEREHTQEEYDELEDYWLDRLEKDFFADGNEYTPVGQKPSY